MTDYELEKFFFAKYNESINGTAETGRRVGQGDGGIMQSPLRIQDYIIAEHNRAMLHAMRAVETEAAERAALVAGDAGSPEGPEFAALIREEFGI